MGKTRTWVKPLRTFAASPWGPLLVTLALGLPRLRFPIGNDAAVFSNAAQAILDGGTLYSDIWFNGFPLNPLLFASIGGILGLNLMTPHFIHLLESLAGVALVYIAGQLALDRKQGLIGAYIFGLFSMLFIRFDVVAEPEFLAGLGSIATTILLLVCLDRYQSQVDPQCGLLVLGAGLATGIAIAAKVVASPLAVVGLFWMWKSRKYFRLRHLFYYTLGAAIVPLTLLVWLATSDAITDMVGQVITFNRYYSSYQGALVVNVGMRVLQAFLQGPVLPLAAIGAVLAAREGNGKRLWLLFWAGAGVAGAVVQGKPWLYHWFFALPPLSLLAAYAVVNAKEIASSHLLFWATGLLIVASAVSVEAVVDNAGKEVAAIVSLLPGRSETEFLRRFEYEGGTMADVRKVASYLASHTNESDRVFVWYYPYAYIMAQRRPASKHAYLLPLVYGSDELLKQTHEELMSDLRQRRPPYIVLPASTGHSWRMVTTTFSTDPFPELLDFVANNYVREAELAESVIYRLRQ